MFYMLNYSENTVHEKDILKIFPSHFFRTKGVTYSIMLLHPPDWQVQYYNQYSYLQYSLFYIYNFHLRILFLAVDPLFVY